MTDRVEQVVDSGRRRALVGVGPLLALICVLLSAPVPVLDEESYLDIASQLIPSHPYDWWRPWQPWGATPEADAFVFAHPPLHLWWVWLVERAIPDELGMRGLKMAAGAPLALLFGWAVSDLALSMTRRPLLALLCWAAAPITVLSLQRGLMPDLAMAALCTTAVATWRRALLGERVAALAGGLALAAATWTKYPAALLLPVLLFHGFRVTGSLRELWRKTAWFWIAAMLPVFIGEAWLLLLYGRLHPVEVIARAGEIGRGHPAVRALGVLARLSLATVPVVFVLNGLRRSLLIGALVGAVSVGLAWVPAQLDPAIALQAWIWATGGAAIVAALVGQLRTPRRGRDPVAAADSLLLSSWALAVIASVLLVHNFSDPRYMLPAVAPVVLLLCRAVEARQTGRQALMVAILVSALASGSLTVAEHRFFVGAAELALRVSRAWNSPGYFTGEWSFRWQMREAGWTFLADQSAPSGTLVAAPLNSSPGELPEVKERVQDYQFDEVQLRVVCTRCRVGLYADTLGVLPVGWSRGPAEEVTAWRIH